MTSHYQCTNFQSSACFQQIWTVLEMYDPNNMGTTGMPSDLVNVEREYINMTATEGNTNRNFPCLKTMGTKPWENKSYCFSNSEITKIWRNILIKLYQSDQQNFLEAEESTEKSLILKNI